MKSNYLKCLASSFALSFVFVSNSIAAPPTATDQSDKVTVDVSKNIVLNARDDDGDDVEIKITTFPTNGTIGGVIYNSNHSTYEAYLNKLRKWNGSNCRLPHQLFRWWEML